nr:sensor histidine kinase [Paraburkholderia sp. NMBU_R16]
MFFASGKIWRDALERDRPKQSEHLGEQPDSAIESTREEEKKRIARELHDELGQQLSALKMDLAALEAELRVGGTQKSVILRIGELHRAIDRAISSVRRVAAGLRPAVLDDLGLLPALEWLVDDFRKSSGIYATLQDHTSDMEFNDPASTALFRIVQEALTNVTRHAKDATEVKVELARHGSVCVQTISDNGIATATDYRNTSDAYPSGLSGIRERVRQLGGTVSMGRSLMHDGFSIVVSVPVHAVIRGRAR